MNKKPVSIAILAMGGQGGGTLSNWIISVAEQADYFAQLTSVPGVAQRTGATVYYIELFPSDTSRPVMALTPVPGDVDIVIAGELIEAGRAIIRELVTAEKTTLISSTHRDYALSEKASLGEGRVDGGKVLAACEKSAKLFIGFDMAKAAADTRSVISSVLLGALCGADVLPFSRHQFLDAIRNSDIAVDSNLLGFEAGYERATQSGIDSSPAASEPSDDADVRDLLERVEEEFPVETHSILNAGVRRSFDYQDLAYAQEYLEQMKSVLAIDDGGYKLTNEVGRYLALWMSYEDSIRVADLKTRASRFDRFRQEVGASPGQIVNVSEFMHPRVEEICDVLPTRLGRRVLGSSSLKTMLGVFCKKGRQIHTTNLSGFLLLFLTSRLRRFRRGTYRFAVENAGIKKWLRIVMSIAPDDYELAVEIAQCPRLIKGYGETHERGLRNFNRILDVLDQVRGGVNSANTIKSFRNAALKDEHGIALDEAMQGL